MYLVHLQICVWMHIKQLHQSNDECTHVGSSGCAFPEAIRKISAQLLATRETIPRAAVLTQLCCCRQSMSTSGV